METKKKYLMSIDIGTQSVRAIVFDVDGNIISNKKVDAEPCYSLKPGWAETPAFSFWKNLCKATNQVRDEIGDAINNVVACGVTANRDNILPLDENNEPLRDWITWLDKRTTPEAADNLKSQVKGMGKFIQNIKKDLFTVIAKHSKFNWLKYNQPEIYAKTKRYVTLSGHIVYLLTNTFNDMVGMQAGYLPFQVEKFDYYKMQCVFDVLGVKREQLADKLVKSGDLVGNVTEKAHKETGLPVGLPIIATGGDKQCETLGSGCCAPNSAVISYGTMASIAITTPKFTPHKEMAYYTWPSTIRDCWNPEFYLDRGYWLVTWFAKQFACNEEDGDFIRKMDKRAAEIPAGSNGLFVFPYWTPHTILMPHAKGLVSGVTDYHTKDHFYRAILEGIAFGLKLGYKMFEKKTKVKIETLNIVGGGSKSDLSMQLTADIFNMKTVRFDLKEVCSLGAMIPAGIYAGVYKDAQDAITRLVKPACVFTPIAKNVEVYQDIFDNVFVPTYKNNLKSFKVLSKYN